MSITIDLSRAGTIHYRTNAGDTFIPFPVSFKVNSVAEDFSGASIKFRIKENDRVIKEITDADGIIVRDNALQYAIDAHEVSKITPGTYVYEVLRIDTLGIITTIQKGTITFNKNSK